MYIGLKNGKILAFSRSQEELELNATIKQIRLDTIEETDEDVVPYYNTANDGLYFKKSEVPEKPKELADEEVRSIRRHLYALKSDPITNNIAVLKDQIEQGDFVDNNEKSALEQEITKLYFERKTIREQIVQENKFLA